MVAFEPPTRKQYGEDRLFSRYGVQVGISLVWNGAHFVETPYPWLGEIAGLKDGVTYFLGGHIYDVDDATANQLADDGFYVRFGYGQGRYGETPYGGN